MYIHNPYIICIIYIIYNDICNIYIYIIYIYAEISDGNKQQVY